MGTEFMDLLTGVGTAIAFIILYAVLFLLAKLLLDLLTPYKLSDELVTRDNPAVGLSVAGYFLATSIIFAGAVSGPSQGFLFDLGAVAGYSLIGILFLNLARLLMDHVTFRRISALKEIVEQKNCGVGSVRCGMFIATGLVAGGSVSGVGGGVLSSVIFFVLGQAALFVFAWIYDRVTPYNLQEEIKGNNVSAGVGFGGTLIAVGIIMADAVGGDFFGWGESLLWFAEVAVLGIVVLIVVRYLMDKLVISGDDLNREIVEDRNLAAGLLEAAVAIAFAFVIAALI